MDHLFPDGRDEETIEAVTHLFPEDVRAELAVTLISARDDLDGMFLGLGIAFVILIASRYYWALAAFFRRRNHTG